MEQVICYGCYAIFEKDSSKVFEHPYIGTIPECWFTNSEILAKGYGDPSWFKMHYIATNIYAAQHSSHQRERRERQSANVHLIVVYLLFGKNISEQEAMLFLTQATAPENKQDWPVVKQLKNPSWLTIKDVSKARSPEELERLVIAWGQSVWEAYRDQHDIIRATHENWLKR